MSMDRNYRMSGKQLGQALLGSVLKLHPVRMAGNPVLFVVEGATALVLLTIAFPAVFHAEGRQGYNTFVFLVLLFTVLFANFAEALAEGRGRAHADALRRTRTSAQAKRLRKDGTVQLVAASELRRKDVILIEQGDIVPGDGEIVDGAAVIDESAVTGESTPVLKRANSDFSSVTGGTLVVSDAVKVRITADPGETFLDRMIRLVEGAKRQKSPNEVALNTLLVVFTLVFLIVVVTLGPIAAYVGVKIETSTLIALLVCLIPTTIGGLLSAIGIAGMSRVTRFNVVAMSGRAVEAAGDVGTVILDKTGTITYGNRQAFRFVPLAGVDVNELAHAAVCTSMHDETPEGRSVLDYAKRIRFAWKDGEFEGGEIVPFTAESRMSGLVLERASYYKGAAPEIKAHVLELGGDYPPQADEIHEAIAKEGGTPLAVCRNRRVLGFIYLKDTIKPGLKEKLAELREMGIKTIMCTGDNRLTAETIAREAGVDEFVAECKPDEKIRVVLAEQAQGKLVAMTGDGTNDAPALAQADVGIAMNSGTTAAKEAANMINLDSDPAKLIPVVLTGKQLLVTRGALTTFSLANDFSKYFAILPAALTGFMPQMEALNVMRLHSPESAVLSALIFNALIIPALIPLAMRGVRFAPMSADRLLRRNVLIYGVGGIFIPFFGIKAVDMALQWIA
ncbi:potassium-transporting ATPase subunit KdpB [Paenibacillus sp. MWE-103]|uniref:Potassium-transporting ATPase ATP-binding subunit n=1 Tax=Paenibacillus artemisiicola TaxID=1172618 RepID=A0ABS3WER1_9BACL|nr:potassium-transporting ATPase subunit KdpB [Paenibacillus artemisiicola]MBO7746789.1 potassium-transporting ATPase subunit KdpB [Paenibacillus artemisiicola]